MRAGRFHRADLAARRDRLRRPTTPADCAPPRRRACAALPLFQRHVAAAEPRDPAWSAPRWTTMSCGAASSRRPPRASGRAASGPARQTAQARSSSSPMPCRRWAVMPTFQLGALRVHCNGRCRQPLTARSPAPASTWPAPCAMRWPARPRRRRSPAQPAPTPPIPLGLSDHHGRLAPGARRPRRARRRCAQRETWVEGRCLNRTGPADACRAAIASGDRPLRRQRLRLPQHRLRRLFLLVRRVLVALEQCLHHHAQARSHGVSHRPVHRDRRPQLLRQPTAIFFSVASPSSRTAASLVASAS